MRAYRFVIMNYRKRVRLSSRDCHAVALVLVLHPGCATGVTISPGLGGDSVLATAIDPSGLGGFGPPESRTGWKQGSTAFSPARPSLHSSGHASPGPRSTSITSLILADISPCSECRSLDSSDHRFSVSSSGGPRSNSGGGTVVPPVLGGEVTGFRDERSESRRDNSAP